MGEVSVDRALAAGFGLIRRHPGALAVWTVVYLLLGVAPQLGIMAVVAPTWRKAMESGAAGGAVSADLMQSQLQMAQIQPLGWLLSIVCIAVLLGAAYRAVLLPEENG